jgi:hypothetical protein
MGFQFDFEFLFIFQPFLLVIVFLKDLISHYIMQAGQQRSSGQCSWVFFEASSNNSCPFEEVYDNDLVSLAELDLSSKKYSQKHVFKNENN